MAWPYSCLLEPQRFAALRFQEFLSRSEASYRSGPQTSKIQSTTLSSLNTFYLKPSNPRPAILRSCVQPPTGGRGTTQKWRQCRDLGSLRSFAGLTPKPLNPEPWVWGISSLMTGQFKATSPKWWFTLGIVQKWP